MDGLILVGGCRPESGATDRQEKEGHPACLEKLILSNKPPGDKKGARTGWKSGCGIKETSKLKTQGGWIVEVDIRKYFNPRDHAHLRELLRQAVESNQG